MCTEQYCCHDVLVEVNPQDLILVLSLADAFTEWNQATWKARLRLMKALEMEDEEDVW